ncbi:MAG: hypothetical protein H0W30_15660 [Gemmatimonadaceae bacterium]|nr:hypothetical protein [Gemmatimonadaceae bacterium]
MRSSSLKRLTQSALIALATLPLGAAAWEACDRVARKPIVNPIVLRPNGCSYGNLSDEVGRSVGNLAREGAVHWTTHVPVPNSGDACLVKHGDGTWDIALVNPGVIDGMAGRTIKMYDGCPDSRIHEADILISVMLNFSQGDQRTFIDRTAVAGSARAATLHEYGHALGLEHDGTAFALMRPSMSSRLPTGGTNNSGSPHYFFADDAFGLLQIGGIPKDVPNFYVTSQVIRDNNQIVNAETDPAGNPLPNPLPVRTRQIVSFRAGAGIHNWWGRGVMLRAYADSSDVCTPLPGVGTSLAFVAVPMSKFATANGVITFAVPPLGPSGQILNVHLAGTLIPAPFQKPETRAWDDCARTGLKLIAP